MQFCKGEKEMTKPKRNMLITSLSFLTILIIVIWVRNYEMINGQYQKLTITKLGGTIMVICDPAEIEKVVELINTSPRSFFLFDSGFKYDYLPHGLFIFEKEEKKVELGFVVSEENKLFVLSNHWEIEMEMELP